MRAGPILASAILALLVIQPVDASHCTTYSTTRTDLDKGVIVLGVEDFVYFPIVFCFSECDGPSSVGYAYWESNGISGLQRGDDIKDDTCHWMIESDSFW